MMNGGRVTTTPNNIRDVIFAAAFAMILLSLVVSCALAAVWPEMFGKPLNSDLENRRFTQLESVLESSFHDGSAQDAFERFAADNIPLRAELMYTNARLQRLCIKYGAAVFGYHVYPTFFGSRFNEEIDDGYLVRSMALVPANEKPAREAWIKTLNDAVRRHPDVRFSVTALTHTRQSELNPTYNLVSGATIDSAWLQANVVDLFDPRLNAVLDPVNKTGKIDDWCFNTDLHWKMGRALDTYNRIANELGWKHWEYENPIRVIDTWYGTDARSGLDQRWASTLWDLDVPFDNLEYHKLSKGKVQDKESSDPGRRLKTLRSAKKKMKQKNIYEGYGKYHGAFNGLIINRDMPDGKNCLLIGDSFSHCLKRYIADNYGRTYCILPGNNKIGYSLEELIQNYDIDDVVVLTEACKYTYFDDYSPKFIGL